MTPETSLKKAIKDILDWRGYFRFHLMAGLGAYPGLPDMIAVKDGRVLFLEIKAPKGTLTEHQKRFEEQIVAHGGEYYVIRNVDDLEKLLSSHD